MSANINFVNTVVIIILLLIFMFAFYTTKEFFHEYFTQGDQIDVTKDDVTVNITPTLDSYIKLYEKFNFQDMVWESDPRNGTNYNGYIKQMVKINLKSWDINLAAYNSEYDSIRRVELWNVYDGENVASLESDFYSSYLDPEYALRANSPKYDLIVRVLPGQHVKLNADKVIKKIIVIAIL